MHYSDVEFVKKIVEERVEPLKGMLVELAKRITQLEATIG